MNWNTPVIEVRGEINRQSAAKFVDELRAARDCFEVEVRIDSDGGAVSAMTTMLDEMNQHPGGRINTVCTGRAASAAACVFLMGRKRQVTPDSYLMIHNVHRSGKSDPDDCRRTSSQIADIISLRTAIDRTQVGLWMDSSQYFDAGNCLRLKLAHSLAPSRLQSSKVDLSLCTLPTTATPKQRVAKLVCDHADMVLARLSRQRRFEIGDRAPAARRQRHAIAIPPLPRGATQFPVQRPRDRWRTTLDLIVAFRNASGVGPAEISIDGEIGEGNDSRSMRQFLRANSGKPVVVRINSPGGLAYDGIAMHNSLVSHNGRVTTVIDGMAGSAASIVAMAGDAVKMFDNASLFIHRASVIAAGNEETMGEAQSWLRKIDDAIARTYMHRTGASLDKIKSLMRGAVDGTVFTAKEAKAGKWVDEIVAAKRMAHSLADLN